MKLNKYKYLFIVGIILLGAGLFYVIKTSSPQSNSTQANISQTNNDNQQSQSGITDQDTKNLENTIVNKLKHTPIEVATGDGATTATINIGDTVQQVIVTKNKDNGFDVLINFNNAGLDNQAMYGVQKMISAIYIAIYRENNSNIDTVTAAAYRLSQDQYGYKKEILTGTSSLNKSEASKYNWALNDTSLTDLLNTIPITYQRDANGNVQ